MLKVINVNKENKDLPVTVYAYTNADDKVTYKIGISQKVPSENGENAWIHDYLLAYFNKDVNFVSGEKIFLKDANLCFYQDKTDKTKKYYYLRVYDFQRETQVNNGEYVEIDDNVELPF